MQTYYFSAAFREADEITRIGWHDAGMRSHRVAMHVGDRLAMDVDAVVRDREGTKVAQIAEKSCLSAGSLRPCPCRPVCSRMILRLPQVIFIGRYH